MTEPTTESEKALALPHLVAAIETKSQMAKDWRLPEYFRDIYWRDAVALHCAYIKLGEAMMLAQITAHQRRIMNLRDPFIDCDGTIRLPRIKTREKKSNARYRRAQHRNLIFLRTL